MRYIFCLVLFGGLVGCGVNAGWVKASRATHDVIAPAHRKYIEGDSALSDAQKRNRLTLLAAWGARIAEWEKEVD